MLATHDYDYEPTCGDRAEWARLAIGGYSNPGQDADRDALATAALSAIQRFSSIGGGVDPDAETGGVDLLCDSMHMLDEDHPGVKLPTLVAKAMSGEDEPEKAPIPYVLLYGLDILAQDEGTTLDRLLRDARMHHDEEVREQAERSADDECE